MKYMDALPPQMKLKVGSDGAKYRRKQMMYQLPIHDHDESYCDNLTESEKESMRQFSEHRNQNALGVGDVREKSNPVSKWVSIPGLFYDPDTLPVVCSWVHCTFKELK